MASLGQGAFVLLRQSSAWRRRSTIETRRRESARHTDTEVEGLGFFLSLLDERCVTSWELAAALSR